MTIQKTNHESNLLNVTPSPQMGALQARAKVLMITDEPASAKIWELSLEQIGLETRLIGICENILETWAEEPPDLIIIQDFNEQIEELEFCFQLRSLTIAPILFFTCKTSELFHFEVYQAGADDCVAFPVTPRLFQAKVKAWLRRIHLMPLEGLDEVHAGGFHLEANLKRLIRPDGQWIGLTILETRLLFLLMSHPGRVFLSEEIVEKVWGHYGEGDSRLLKNHIYRLRRKIEPDPAHPCYLVSEGYSGYQFRVEENSPRINTDATD